MTVLYDIFNIENYLW